MKIYINNIIIMVLIVVTILSIDKTSNTVKDEFLDETKDKLEVLYTSQDTLKDNIEQVSKEVETETETVFATYYGKMTGYGPDCAGCYGKTASGTYVGDGNIYYDDYEYGKVRIVAGDPSIPFGTIVRISNIEYVEEEIYAIVLDRGSAIGFNRYALFDLLFPSERDTGEIGLEENACFEILRYGY